MKDVESILKSILIALCILIIIAGTIFRLIHVDKPKIVIGTNSAFGIGNNYGK